MLTVLHTTIGVFCAKILQLDLARHGALLHMSDTMQSRALKPSSDPAIRWRGWRWPVMRGGTVLRCALNGLLLLLVPLGYALGASNSNAYGLPPLFDRQLFFGDPEISGATISPDGRFISFLRPYHGVRNIWVKLRDEPFDRARPVTADASRPVGQYGQYLWSQDSKFILYAQDQGGDENFNLYAVDVTVAPEPGREVPPTRNLTNLRGVRTTLYGNPRTKPDIAYIGLNDRDRAWHDLYELNLSTGQRTLLRKNDKQISTWLFDLDGNLRLGQRAATNGDTQILRLDPGGDKPIYQCTVFETCNVVAFHPDGRHVYLFTNAGTGTNVIHLALLDVMSGQERPVVAAPGGRVDLASIAVSAQTQQVVGAMYYDDMRHYIWLDKSMAADYRFLRQHAPGPGLDVSPAGGTRDHRWMLATFSSDTEPGATYLLDRQTRTLSFQFSIRPALPRSSLARMQPIRYRSTDGLEIPAYLTLPVGIAPQGLPLVVMPHGGPWSRDIWVFNPWTQFFANRGFAVLQPNFRGSTGYGKRFEDAGNRQWGTKMQDDITFGVRHLIAKGIVDPQRVAIYGGSYGGYTTLAGVTFTPELYRAAVDYVGPTNLITLINSLPPYWAPIHRMFIERTGDPSTPEGRAQLARQSPINFVQRIRTPMIVIQGANDPRVNREESDSIVRALYERGSEVEYLVADNEGHGFVTPLSQEAMFAEIEKFFAAQLGTRFQETVSPEVAERIAILKIDPSKVKVAEHAAN